MNNLFVTKKLGLVVVVVVIIVLLIVGIFVSFGAKSVKLKTLTINGGPSVKVELATTEEQWAQGLSGRQALPPGQGMIFLFTDYSVKKFWMKDLNFPLDLVWIYDGKIIGIEKNLPPAGSKPTVSYASPGPVNLVLEVNGGWVEANTIKVGDVILIK